MDLNEYQRQSSLSDQRKEKTTNIGTDFLIPLLGLVGEIGSVASEYKKHLRDGNSYPIYKEKLKEELGDVLWYVAVLAQDMGLSLEEIAQLNLDKTKERWKNIDHFSPPVLFDEKFLKKEQFPREVMVEFRENEDKKIEMIFDGKQLGSPLSDNAYIDDGYRFHDVFHLSYMAVLGWSPVIRALLKKKRKSVPIVDEVEDGARAIIVEESISAIVYELSKAHNGFKDLDYVDSTVLEMIKRIVQNFEVKSMGTALWQKAILDGYKAFRELRKHNGGKVYLNLNKRTIKFLC